MATLALVNYIWNPRTDPREAIRVKGGECSVEYVNRYGETCTMYYQMKVNQHSPNRTNLKVWVNSVSGGWACILDMVRSSNSSDSEITVTHGTNHTSGLREKYRIWSSSIKGRHENSIRYGAFESVSLSDDRRQLSFRAEVQSDRFKAFTFHPYKLKLVNVEIEKLK
jgi:hypothetical protein